MKMSEMLKCYTVIAPPGTDQRELRLLLLKAYRRCWDNRKTHLSTNPFTGPYASTRTLNPQTTYSYFDDAVTITYQNQTHNTSSPGAALQVQVRKDGQNLMALNASIEFPSNSIRILTYNPDGVWRQHLLDL